MLLNTKNSTLKFLQHHTKMTSMSLAPNSVHLQFEHFPTGSHTNVHSLLVYFCSLLWFKACHSILKKLIFHTLTLSYNYKAFPYTSVVKSWSKIISLQFPFSQNQSKIETTDIFLKKIYIWKCENSWEHNIPLLVVTLDWRIKVRLYIFTLY
jgi:hypothetical protein